MITKEDIDYLFDELWPMMYRSKQHKQNCLDHFEEIESCFKKWDWDWDNLLDNLVKIYGIGPTIGSGLIWAANRKTAVPFDKFTMTYAHKLRLISNNRITGGGYMYACNEIENFCKDFEITLEDGAIRPYEIEDFVVDARYETEHLPKDEIIDPI
jgi:hypothetical protein